MGRRSVASEAEGFTSSLASCREHEGGTEMSSTAIEPDDYRALHFERIGLLCDVIFMSESATIADPHVRIGIVAGDGGTAIWPLAVGPARAKQYLLTGDPVPAVEAERLGLVNTVTTADALQGEALAFAERLAAGAPLAIRYTKQAVNKLVKDALNVAFDTATALEIVTFRSDDHQEALAAIREKRFPEFKGR